MNKYFDDDRVRIRYEVKEMLELSTNFWAVKLKYACCSGVMFRLGLSSPPETLTR